MPEILGIGFIGIRMYGSCIAVSNIGKNFLIEFLFRKVAENGKGPQSIQDSQGTVLKIEGV